MSGRPEDGTRNITPRQILEDAGRQARKFREGPYYSEVIGDMAREDFEEMDPEVADVLTSLVMARVSRLGGYERVLMVPSLAENILERLGVNSLTGKGITAVSLGDVEKSLRAGLLRPDLGIAEHSKNP